MRDQEPEALKADENALPVEMGIKAARGILGALARRAAEEGTITYLTISGERIAAIVPAAPLHTDDEPASVHELRRQVEHLDEQTLRLQAHITSLQAECARRLDGQEQEQGQVAMYIGLWRELERRTGHRLDVPEELAALLTTVTRAAALASASDSLTR